VIKLSASFILISSLIGSFALALSADDLMTVSAIAAANYNNPTIQKSFKELIDNYKNRDEFQILKNSSEGQKAIRTAERVLNIQIVKDKLSACFKGNGLNDKNIQSLIEISAKVSLNDTQFCLAHNQSSRLAQDVDRINKEALQSLIVNQAQINLSKTKDFWNSVRQEDPVKVAMDLSLKLIDIKHKPPTQGRELLFYTSALDDAKKNGIVESKDVKNGLNEIARALESQEKKLSQPNLEDLVKFQPAAVAEVLLSFPEAATQLCSTFELIEEKNRINNNLNNLTNLMWGGLVVGGILLTSTGVGAVPGAALTMTALAGVSIAHSGRQSYDAFQEASQLRDSFLTNSSGSDNLTKVDEKTQEAYEQLINSAILSPGLVLPFRAARAASQQAIKESKMIRSSSLNKLEESLAPVRATNATIQEINRYPNLSRVLEKFNADETAELVSGLSKSDPSIRTQVIKKISESEPDKIQSKIRQAIEELKICKR
jgi:hypothetical protein